MSMGNTRKVLNGTSWLCFDTSAGTLKHRAKGKPRPHAKVPAKVGAFSPQPLDVVMFFLERETGFEKLLEHSTVQVLTN